MAFPKYQTKEVLNKVLNAGEDALKIDIDNVTLDGSQLSVDIDNENDSIVIFSNTAADGSGTNTVPLVDAAGHLQVDVLTTTANDSIVTLGDTAYTEATSKGTAIGGVRNDSLSTLADTENEWSPLQVNASGALYVDGSDATQPVSGTVSVSGLLADGHAVTIDNTDSNEVYVRGSGTAGSADAKVLTVQGIASGTALAVTESSPISGFATATLQGAGLPSALSSDNLKVSIQEGGFDGVVTITDTSFAVADGNALGEGILVQGDDGSDRKNIHVDATTGDVQVDVTDIVPGYAATSLGKREDDPHSNLDTGVMALAVRNDDVAALASADNDYAPLQVNATGSLYTVDETGAAGSILVTGTGAITAAPSNSCFVAIQFLEDTIFDSTDGLIAVTEQLYPDDNGTGTTVSSSNGANTDGVTFPQGMTIFGRWSGFKLTATGAVIAYLGYESA